MVLVALYVEFHQAQRCGLRRGPALFDAVPRVLHKACVRLGATRGELVEHERGQIDGLHTMRGSRPAVDPGMPVHVGHPRLLAARVGRLEGRVPFDSGCCRGNERCVALARLLREPSEKVRLRLEHEDVELLAVARRILLDLEPRAAPVAVVRAHIDDDRARSGGSRLQIRDEPRFELVRELACSQLPVGM